MLSSRRRPRGPYSSSANAGMRSPKTNAIAETLSRARSREAALLSRSMRPAMRRGDGVACASRLCAVKVPCSLPLILTGTTQNVYVLRTRSNGRGHRTDAATHVSTLTIGLRDGDDTNSKSKIARICRGSRPFVSYVRARLQPLVRIRVRLFRGRGRDRRRDDAALSPPRSVQTDARETPHVRIGRGAGRPGMGSLPHALLRVRAPLRRVRRRSDLPLPVGGALPRSRSLRPPRDGGLHRDPRRRPLLRLEEKGAQ